MLSRLLELHQQHRHSLRSLLRFCLYWLALFLIALAYWVTDNFGGPSLEQVLYHLQFGMDGLVDTDPTLIKSFVHTCVLLPLCGALCITAIEIVLAWFLAHTRAPQPLLLPRLNLRLLKTVYWMIGHRAPLYLMVFAVAYFGTQFSLQAFVHNQFGRDYFAANYIYPNQVRITPAAKPSNLVLIYVESMENSYRDSSLFGSNLLASLDAQDGTSFDHFRQVPGTTWTIAGIVATQCGIPLKSVSLYDGNGQGENIKSFLPSAVCLGDILHRHGYRNVYMGGDALHFSGKGRFFQDHHYDEVYGRDELKAKVAGGAMNEWGLFDDDLLAQARSKLVSLHRAGRPFNLTITTIDTHGPDGFISKRCRAQGSTDFAGVVQCTSMQVAELVQFMRASGYLKDTRVVILGDHLAMANPLSAQLSKLPERHVFNSLISQRKVSKNRNEVVHFDMFPTMLDFIGLQVQDGRLGLGYTAIAANAVLPPASEYEDMSADLLNDSDAYLGLWAERVPGQVIN